MSSQVLYTKKWYIEDKLKVFRKKRRYEMPFDVIVKHPILGMGKILAIHLNTESPIISILWEDGNVSNYPADELEFLPIQR